MSNNVHKKGTYIRFRVSPQTVRGITDLGSKAVETVLGINSIRNGLQVKKAIERQNKINARLETGKSVAEITTGIASAIQKLF